MTANMFFGSSLPCKSSRQQPCATAFKLCRFASHTSIMNMPNTVAEHSRSGQKTCFLAHCCFTKAADSRLVPLQSNLCNFDLSYRFASTQHCCRALYLMTANMLFGSSLPCKSIRQQPCATAAEPMQVCLSYKHHAQAGGLPRI